ncbi:MAG TPA: hypothetical protein VNM22_19900 [Candidatus Limnocylindrales bacterium]|nr:hypothetical protein [Candidatus Limnocylindrales bacterium]
MKRAVRGILLSMMILFLGSLSYGAEGPGNLPEIPKRKELPKRNLQAIERPKLRTLPRGAGWADSYLPEYTRNVLDPMDGTRAGDGRVAVMQGPDARIIYEFAPGEEAVNGPGPDLTVYTSESRRYSGPYDVYVANYGAPEWILVGQGIIGTASFEFPPSVRSAQLVLLMNRHAGETEIDGVQALHPGEGGRGEGGSSVFDYYPDELVGLWSDRIDTNEVIAARSILRGRGNGYRMPPNGEIEVSWNRPITNVWGEDDLLIDADGSYQVWITDTRGREVFLGQGINTQRFALPGDVTAVSRVRVKADSRRSVTIYSIAGRR